jgi:hypothetical protein
VTTTLLDLARPEAERLARGFAEAMSYAHGAALRTQQPIWPFPTREAEEASVSAFVALLCDLTRQASMDYWRRFLAEREGLDPRRGVTFRREHKWEGGAWYSLVAEARDPDDHTTSGDPSRWYASESIEQLMSTEADRILPALAHGPDEAEALAIIIAAVVAGGAA